MGGKEVVTPVDSEVEAEVQLMVETLKEGTKVVVKKKAGGTRQAEKIER